MFAKYAFEHRPTDVIQGDFNGDGIEDFLTIDKQYIMRPPEYMDSINIVLEVQTIDKKEIVKSMDYNHL